jgi:hypothetical protein
VVSPSTPPKFFTYEGSVSPTAAYGDLWRFSGPSSMTGITYNSDGSASVASLSPGVSYAWCLDAIDRFGNTARNSALFSPP